MSSRHPSTVSSELKAYKLLSSDNFSLSAYVINWNKAIGVTLSSHPGSVLHLVENPADPSKLLIGFASGTIALWDLVRLYFYNYNFKIFYSFIETVKAKKGEIDIELNIRQTFKPAKMH